MIWSLCLVSGITPALGNVLGNPNFAHDPDSEQDISDLLPMATNVLELRKGFPRQIFQRLGCA